jgi:hypothetical protein
MAAARQHDRRPAAGGLETIADRFAIEWELTAAAKSGSPAM